MRVSLGSSVLYIDLPKTLAPLLMRTGGASALKLPWLCSTEMPNRNMHPVPHAYSSSLEKLQ